MFITAKRIFFEKIKYCEQFPGEAGGAVDRSSGNQNTVIEKIPETMSDIDLRRQLRCELYPFASLESYQFVVVCSRYGGKWLLSRHRERETWECQGGHIEQGETPLQAALRELYEESGVRDVSLYPVCDYRGYDPAGCSGGQVFLADVHRLGTMPESEIRETALFDEPPKALTYPEATPRFLEEAYGVLRRVGGA